MRPPPSACPENDALVRLLEQSFQSGAGDGLGRGVPTALWDRALLDPLRDFLTRPSKGFRARLLDLGYRLAGGNGNGPPRELGWLIEVLHAGSLIVDDIEDDSADRRGEPALHRRHGVAVALNVGNWLYFCAPMLLSRVNLGLAARLEAHERLAECLLRSHEGQGLDLTVFVEDLRQDEVEGVVEVLTGLKTGRLLGLATALGAIAAGAVGAPVTAIDGFGREIGIGLQMLDDLSGIVNPARHAKAIEDLRHGRATWVWAWLARELSPTEYAEARVALRAVRAGGCPEGLIATLRSRLDDVGPTSARARFQHAEEMLRAALPAGACVEVARAAVDDLARRYLEHTHGG